MDKVPLTIKGFAALEEELKRRQQVERPRIIQQITEARGHGDLSENAEYHAAKEAQSHNEGRIAELEDKLARAEVIDVSKLSGDTVKFGATVTLMDEDTDKYAIKIVDQNLLLFDTANAPVTLDDRLETAFVSTFQLD